MPHLRPVLLAACAAATLLATTPALTSERAGDFPGIRKLMTAEEFERAGLARLTPEELAALDSWLLRYTASDAELVGGTSKEVRAVRAAYRVEANVVAPFRGWSGQTLFRLENGQLWRQRIQGRFSYSGDDTRVVIERNRLGFFVMRHVASGRTIGVEFVR